MAKKTTAKNDNTKSDATDRDTELEKALQKIKKAFGEGAFMKMGDRPELKVDFILGSCTRCRRVTAWPNR